MAHKNPVQYFIFLVLLAGAYFTSNPEHIYSYLMGRLHYPINLSPLLVFKLHLLKINIFCFVVVMLWLYGTGRIQLIISALLTGAKKQFGNAGWCFIVLILMQTPILLIDIADAERLLYEYSTGRRLQFSTSLLPNNAEPADLHLPEDFSQFIAEAQQKIPMNAHVLYLGVERHTANYYLYPRIVYQSPEYEWIGLPVSEIRNKAMVKEKKISFIIRKYRPAGYTIEKITP
jgi:hypothetical protein